MAKVIGANKHCDGYLEGGGYVVSWCMGHLVELSPPQAYDERYGKWRYEDLPILPQEWHYEVSPSTKKQYGVLKKLTQRKDLESLICATRFFSCLYSQTLNVGRVMTPTLAMVVMRDAAIRAFKPDPFYTAELDQNRCLYCIRCAEICPKQRHNLIPGAIRIGRNAWIGSNSTILPGTFLLRNDQPAVQSLLKNPLREAAVREGDQLLQFK